MEPTPVKEKSLFLHCCYFTIVVHQFIVRAWQLLWDPNSGPELQIIRSLLSVSPSLFFITIYMIITLSMAPLSQKRLDFLFFPFFNIQMIHCLTLKCTYGVGIKNPRKTSQSERGYGRNCPLARDFTTCKVQ